MHGGLANENPPGTGPGGGRESGSAVRWRGDQQEPPPSTRKKVRLRHRRRHRRRQRRRQHRRRPPLAHARGWKGVGFSGQMAGRSAGAAAQHAEEGRDRNRGDIGTDADDVLAPADRSATISDHLRPGTGPGGGRESGSAVRWRGDQQEPPPSTRKKAEISASVPMSPSPLKS